MNLSRGHKLVFAAKSACNRKVYYPNNGDCNEIDHNELSGLTERHKTCAQAPKEYF